MGGGWKGWLDCVTGLAVRERPVVSEGEATDISTLPA